MKKHTPSHFIDHLTIKSLLHAEGFYDKKNKELREKAVEHINPTSEGCSIIAVLIATVAFAFAYTIPEALFSNAI